ncbi:zinc finger and BTB domain-containing protein 41-like isoform X2 [Artemia franciscana]|uniref:zinc finger and BTB domain-containing protein 41-like isoform X2 n=1 Tax=Artemia franciscana TaxID=6661 RepID=UPI0032DA3212
MISLIMEAEYIYPCDTFCAQLYKQTNPGLSYKLEDNPLVNLPRISVKVEYDSDPLQLEPATTNNKEAEDVFLNCNEQLFGNTNPVPQVKPEDSPFIIDPGKFMVLDPDPLQLDSTVSMTKSGRISTNSLNTFTNEIDGSSISLHSAADYEVLSTKDSLSVTNTELVQIILKSEDNSEVEDETRTELLSSSLDSLKKFEEYDQKEAQTAVEISDKFVRSISAAKAMLMGYDLPKLEVAYSDTEGKQKVYLCCYCNLCFSNLSDRSSHIESHNVKIICPICCIEFFSHKIVQHLVDFHGKKRNAKSLTPKESIPAMTKSLLKGFELTELTTVYDKRSNKIVFPCCYCSDIFYSKTERENHLPNHDVKAQCHLCLQEFPSHKIKSHVKYVHVKSAANKLKDFCELCNGFYPDLSRHCTDRHSKSSVIRRFCIYCENASFATSEELLNHYEANHDDEKLACNVCDEYIFSFQQKKHMMEHGSKTKKLCPHCGKLFRFLATHVKAVHQGRTRKRPKRVQCDQCAKFLHNKQKLQFHYLSFHNPDLKCDICSKKFGSLKALNGHKRKLHKPQCNLKKRNNKLTEANKKVVMVKCAVCKKEIACIRLFAHLVYHVWKEIGHTYDRQLQFVEQDVACPTCNAQFRCTHYLANHMTRHLDPARVYECPCCFRTFKRIGRFDFHKKSFCKTLDETVAYTMQCRTKNQLCKNKLRRRRNGHDIDAE